MQQQEKDMKNLTTTAGAPIADNQNSQTAGPRGSGSASGLSVD